MSEEELRAMLLRLEAELKKVQDAKNGTGDEEARTGLAKLEGRLTTEIERLGKEFAAALGKLTPPPAPAASKGWLEEFTSWLGL